MVIVRQITRGVAPVRSIVQAMKWAQAFYVEYDFTEGLPLAEAKNKAASDALERGADLFLVEDDVTASPELWQQFLTPDVEPRILFASANTRWDKSNTVYAPDGTLIYSGNIFVRIPLWVLQAMKRPIFKPWCFTIRDGKHVMLGESSNGSHSDESCWYHARLLHPVPEMVELGRVTHLKHPLNDDQQQHKKPCKISEW